MEPQLSNGAPNRIRLRLSSGDPQDVRLRVRDDAPIAFDVDRRTHDGVLLPARGTAVVEYETERQQRVLILLDVGRMMASTIRGLTKLDHVVNTALMLAFVAITKGDEVGLLAYADGIVSYAPSRRGKGQFRRITEELRRLELKRRALL